MGYSRNFVAEARKGGGKSAGKRENISDASGRLFVKE